MRRYRHIKAGSDRGCRKEIWNESFMQWAQKELAMVEMVVRTGRVPFWDTGGRYLIVA